MTIDTTHSTIPHAEDEKSVEAYLDTLRAQGLLATVSEIAPFDQFI